MLLRHITSDDERKPGAPGKFDRKVPLSNERALSDFARPTGESPRGSGLGARFKKLSYSSAEPSDLSCRSETGPASDLCEAEARPLLAIIPLLDIAAAVNAPSRDRGVSLAQSGDDEQPSTSCAAASTCTNSPKAGSAPSPRPARPSGSAALHLPLDRPYRTRSPPVFLRSDQEPRKRQTLSMFGRSSLPAGNVAIPGGRAVWQKPGSRPLAAPGNLPAEPARDQAGSGTSG